MLDLVLKTAAAAEPVTTGEAKHHLRVDFDDENDLIEAYIASATAYLDGPAGILGRALVEQSWTLYLDRFPACSPGAMSWPGFTRRHHHRLHRAAIRLPLPPLISVDEVRYVDGDGVQQILAADQYTVRDGEIAALEPAFGSAWPASRWQPRAVAVDFTCGYGPPDTVPKPLQIAILQMTGDLWETRTTQLLAERAAFADSGNFKRLVAPYRLART